MTPIPGWRSHRVFLVIIGMLCLAFQVEAQVIINEVLASNVRGLLDENGDTSDWLELHNQSKAEVDLTGWGLSDNRLNPFKWKFRDGRIPAGGFLTVFASGKDRHPELHAALDPATIPGVVLWLNAGSLNTNDSNQIRRVGSSIFVKQWWDSSSRKAHGTAPADNAQPLWIPPRASQPAALRFDGIDDQLLLGQVPATNDFCLLVVARAVRGHENEEESVGSVGGVAGQRYLLGARHGGDLDAGAGVSMGTNGVAVFEHGSGYMPALASYPSRLASQFHIITVQYANRQPHLYVDTLLARVGIVSPRRQVTAPTEIGSGSYGAFGGEIAEILLVNRALDPKERAGLERSLANRYQIPVSEPRHTNFQLNTDGEELLLTQPNGTWSDRMTFPKQTRDISFGRQPDGTGDFYFFSSATPGASNTTLSASEFLSPPHFSVLPGFYSQPQSLELTTASLDAQIHYTLDGSEPTSSSTRYTSPIPIRSRQGTPNQLAKIQTIPGGPVANGEVFKGTVVRAKTFKIGAIASETMTRTYFIDPKGRTRYTLPIASIATDQRHFFSAETGIYVPGNQGNYNQRGAEWERPASFEWIEMDNSVPVSQSVDVKIHGNTSQGFPIKGLDLDATGVHGNRPFRYRFFSERTRSEFEHVLLRPTGHDQPTAFMRDEFMQSLGAETGAESQASRLCLVFINGEYWGLHYLKEKQDAEFVAYYSGLTEDTIDYLEGYATAKAGDTTHYNALLQFAAGNDPANPLIYAELARRMDIPNYIDYKACEIFFYRWDIGNHRLWRPRTPEGRWRWLQFDNDVGWGGFWAVQPAWEFNMLSAVLTPDGSLNGHNNETTTFLLRRLMLNPEFRRVFVNRFADLLNTTLSPSNTIDRIQTHARPLDPEMAEHIRRWGSPGSLSEWRANVQYLHTYALKRPAAMRQQLQRRFNLGPPIRLQLDQNFTAGGNVQLNSLTLSNLAANPFTGQYFRHHPISLIAKPAAGYRFDGWDGLPPQAGPIVTVAPASDLNVQARFVPESARSLLLSVKTVPAGTSRQLNLVGSAGAQVLLEESVNLQDWSSVLQITLNNEGVATTDIPAINAQSFRYFRARYVR